MIDYRENNKCTVYIHTSPSGKYYVGITSRKPNQRWCNGRGYIKNVYFTKAIKKYGWDNFMHEIIAEHLTRQEACNFEKALIKSLNSNNYKFGYNICSGGEGATGLFGKLNHMYGKHVSKETIEKIKKTKNDNPFHHTDEWKLGQSKRSRTWWDDKEKRNTMSGENAPCYGRIGELHPLYGKTGKECSISKPVICLNTLEIFDSATIASKEKNANHSKLCMCCRGERASCGKDENGNKLKWMFLTDYESIEDK